MIKKMFVVLMCVFMMAGVAFADRPSDDWVPPGHRYKGGNSTVDDHSINDSFNIKNSFNNKTINNSKTFNKTIDNSTTIKDNKIGVNDNVIKDNVTQIGGKGNVAGDQINIKGKGTVITGDNNSVDFSDKRQMNAKAEAEAKAEANNEGVAQEVNVEGDDIKYEADKRELIQGPVLSFPQAQLGNGKEDSILIKGSLFAKTKTVTKKQLKTLLPYGNTDYFMGPDAKVEIIKLEENEFVTDKVTYGKPEGNKVRYVGSVYIISEGAAVMSLEALAADAAMKMGGTHLIAPEMDSFVESTGSSKGFSIGGNASAFAKGDDVAVAPGAMFGWSKIKASNKSLGSILFDVYTDDSILVGPPAGK